MTKLQQLIKELCPNGVEHRRVGDCIRSLKTGLNPRKNFILNEPENTIPYVTGKDVYNNKINVSERTDKISAEALVLINKRANLESDLLLFASTGTGTVGRMAVIEKYDNNWGISETLYAMKPNKDILLTKYLMHVLYSSIAKNQYEPKISRGSVPHLKVSDLLNINIPVPPIPVQMEIVRILDKLTEKTDKLILELNNELEDRRKQHNYYVGKILTFDENTPVYEIGEVCKLSAGGDAPKERMSKEKNDIYSIPIYSNGMGKNALYGFTDIPKITEHCVTVAARGTIGYSEVRKEPFYPIIRLICCVPTDKIDTEFLCYIIKTLKFKIPDGGIPQLTVPMLSKYKIHVPDLDIQKQIVSLLNKYSSAKEQMISSIQKEIDLHKKQYEYYRDKLLTF